MLAIVGPTATGKTAAACAIAPALDAEIVCVDSMTIYRGMDIGTAKPDGSARARVPHHLLDVADPGEAFSVSRFQRLATDAIAGIEGRGARAMLVGGSGLYFHAVVDELGFPPTDPAVRARLEAEELDALAERLRAADPVAAGLVNLANKRRVVRALEVIELTGAPFSSYSAQWDRRAVRSENRPLAVAGLDARTEVLRDRVEARARAMLERGLLDEVRSLVAGGFRDALTASQAVGYAQAIEVLEGRAEARDFVERTTRSTMRLIRRQRAWFRRDARITWFDAEGADVAAQIQAYLAAAI